VKEQLKELTVYCEPTFITDSSLECSDYARFCRGRNIMVNFTDLVHRKEPMRYAMDVLKQGEIGGFCRLNERKLKEQLQHLSALQSWTPELRFFESLPQRPIENNLCDVVIEKPTFIMKIDATLNMYHHFCDFFNLYASQHINFTRPGAFSTDINILLWESYHYKSSFSQTFEAFTENPLWDLNTFKGKVVCFKNLVLPLLPRMIYGLYYNTPIVSD
jgi:EGF domain-specific O-GlcNAc transferase